MFIRRILSEPVLKDAADNIEYTVCMVGEDESTAVSMFVCLCGR